MKKIYLRAVFYLLFAAITFENVWAQDPQFSMFYAVPLYLNPAFAGGRHANRALFHQRWQWPNQDARYTTSMFSFDTYAPMVNSGFGIMAMQDYQGGNRITDTWLSASYAYELGITQNKTLRFGLQGGFIQRSLNDFRTTRETEDLANGGTGTGDDIGQNRLMPDIASGIIYYDRNLYGGLTLNHMNRPNTSMIGRNEPMPVKITLVGGYKIPIPLTGGSLGKKGLLGAPDYLYLTPTFTYKTQGGSGGSYVSSLADQVDLGLYLTRLYYIFGVWYRGIPFKGVRADGQTLRNNESIVFLLGGKYLGIGFGYSFDLTISSQRVRNTGGAHELNLTYTFRTKRKKGPARRLPCPDFEEDILQKAGMGVGK